jgi:DNA-directed RNA polymerase II subunit RPB2
VERDCLIAHGTANLLKERLFEQSDAYVAHICGKCGLIAEPARSHRPNGVRVSIRAEVPYCRNCDATETVREVKIPYACKLLAQELMACNIAMRFVLNETDQENEESTPALQIHEHPPDGKQEI